MALIGDLKPFFYQVNTLLRQVICAVNAGGGVGSNVTVINPPSSPVNVTLVPASGSPITQITSAGTGSIPAGFKSISLVKTSSNADTVIITLSDTSTFTMTELGEVFGDSSTDGNLLPAYTISGVGTFKWHGVK